jgi:heat shock protein HtpX
MGIQNQLKTVVLLGLLSLLLVYLGSLFGERGLYIGLAFALGTNFFSYFFSDKIVLAMYRAKEVSEKDYPEFYKSVRHIAQRAKTAMPKVYVIPTNSTNAFATGRNPKNAAVACTQGILELLTHSELEAVIAHEIGHIKNRDILIATIAATIASVIAFMASMARWAAIFGGFGGRNSDRGSSGIQLLFLAILAPIIAMIIQFAISRSREFIADETSAKLTKNPHALITALQKIENNVKTNPMRIGNQSTSSLFILNPFTAKGFIKLFSTHPPTDERVARLKKM